MALISYLRWVVLSTWCSAVVVLVALSRAGPARGGPPTTVVRHHPTPEVGRVALLRDRPANEPGFRLERQDVQGRVQHYAIKSYTSDRPPAEH